MNFLSMVDLFGAGVLRMTLQVPIMFQDTPLKQRVKHTLQSSHGDQMVTQSSFPHFQLCCWAYFTVGQEDLSPLW